MTKRNKIDSEQRQRFREAAREAGADMTKEEFARVIGGLAKPTPPPESTANQSQKPKERDDT